MTSIYYQRLIDSRYRSRKPLIITTNLPLSILKHPENIDQKRIYERILACCIPVKMNSGNIRAEMSEEKFKDTRESLFRKDAKNDDMEKSVE